MRPQETSESNDQASAQVTPIMKAVRPAESPAEAPTNSVPSSPPNLPPGPPAGTPPVTSPEDPSKARRRLAVGGGVLTGAAVLHGWLYHVGYRMGPDSCGDSGLPSAAHFEEASLSTGWTAQQDLLA